MRESAPAAFGDAARLPVPEGVPRAPAAALEMSAPTAPPSTDRPIRGEYDPLRLCIYTTIGIIAWLITPPLTVAIFGTIGVVGYWRARRRGLASSRCLLGDTRLVIAYLAAAAVAGATWTVMSVFG